MTTMNRSKMMCLVPVIALLQLPVRANEAKPIQLQAMAATLHGKHLVLSGRGYVQK